MKNQYEIRGTVTAIFLKRKNGDVLETTIDTADLEKAKEFPNTWFAAFSPLTQSFYCKGEIYLPGGAVVRVQLHRWITDCPENIQVDHFNNDTLNNRRKNLRLTTSAQNNQNRAGAQRNSKSGIRGVYWDGKREAWRAVITLNYRHKHIGRFATIQEAEAAIKKARAKYMPFSKEAEEVIAQ